MNKENTKIQIIGGPCSAESKEQILSLARWAEKLGWTRFRAGLWKPRTRPGFFEGVGKKGLSWLAAAEEVAGVPAMTEVATPGQAEQVLKAGIGGFWIGARTTVNPFYVQEIAEVVRGADCEVWVKNPIHPDLYSWIGAIERFQSAGLKQVGAIHRGFYLFRKSDLRNSPVWSIPLGLKKYLPEVPVYCDISHIGGQRQRIPLIFQQALYLPFSGVMVEVHEEPSLALTDSEQQLKPGELKEMIEKWAIENASSSVKSFMDKSILDHEKGPWHEVIEQEIERLIRIRNEIPYQMNELISHFSIESK